MSKYSIDIITIYAFHHFAINIWVTHEYEIVIPQHAGGGLSPDDPDHRVLLHHPEPHPHHRHHKLHPHLLRGDDMRVIMIMMIWWWWFFKDSLADHKDSHCEFNSQIQKVGLNKYVLSTKIFVRWDKKIKSFQSFQHQMSESNISAKENFACKLFFYDLSKKIFQNI